MKSIIIKIFRFISIILCIADVVFFALGVYYGTNQEDEKSILCFEAGLAISIGIIILEGSVLICSFKEEH